jgi:hypothetical protein
MAARYKNHFRATYFMAALEVRPCFWYTMDMQLIFREDINRDITNWQASLVMQKTYEYVGDFKGHYFPKDIPLEKAEDREYLRNYLQEKFYATGKITIFKEWLEANANAEEIQSDLIELMKGKFLAETFLIYITVFGLGNYSSQENRFYVIYRSPERDRKERISAIYHELMHFLFHWHYWDQCLAAGLSDQEIHNLKESLTVLLNPILAKRGLPLDNGYPVHAELRKQWTTLYEENPDFPAFLEKAIPLYKESLVIH